ncbi:MAG: two-component system response regulator [Thermoplasmata archaeon]|nr:MAG: two-component system response regulator [Thermoplasmata archaeon]
MRTILVVDDEPDIQESVKTILERANYNVVVASDGKDCLEKMRTIKPDLILLDIMMPGIPTKEIIRKITDTKIIFLSVVRTSEIEKEDLLRQENIVDFIQKPFDVNDLLERIRKVLNE